MVSKFTRSKLLNMKKEGERIYVELALKKNPFQQIVLHSGHHLSTPLGTVNLSALVAPVQ